MVRQTGYFETAINFGGRHFDFEKDCVGAEVHFSFRGQHFIICLPRFDFDDWDRFGHPKPTLEGSRVRLPWLLRDDEDHVFGQELYRDDVNETVLGFACNHLIIRSRGQVTANEARKAKASLELWRDVFAKWWEVIGYDDLERSSISVEQHDSLECYFIDPVKGKKVRRIKSSKENSASIIFSLPAGIDRRRLQRVLKYSADGKYPPGYYIQLIDALKHYNQEKYRQSILDSATATEMALTQLLDNRLAAATPQQRRLIFDRYKQISGLIVGLKGLGETLPAGLDAKIGTPRNRAIHKGTEVTRDQAKEALELARTFLYAKLPF
jgi:hypothetical protein